MSAQAAAENSKSSASEHAINATAESQESGSPKIAGLLDFLGSASEDTAAKLQEKREYIAGQMMQSQSRTT